MKVKIQATPLLKKIEQSDARTLILQGGTGSSKTYSTLQSFIGECWKARMRRERILATVTSVSLPHLKKGAYRDFKEILLNAQMYDPVFHNKTDHQYSMWGSKIEFLGLDDPTKARGPRRDFVFMNEANLLTSEHYRQLAQRTKQKVVLDLNPSDNHSWVYELADSGDPDVEVIISNYKDNPFLSPGEVKEIEKLVPVWQTPDGVFRDWDIKYEKEDPPPGWVQIGGDYNLWKVYGLGMRGSPKEIIYDRWAMVPWKDAPAPEDCETIYGVDFGFNNPSAIVEVRIRDMTIYARQRLYRSGLLNSEIIEEMKRLGIPKNAYMYADAAEPDRIEEIRKAGFNCRPADKSVKDGIDYVKRHGIFLAQDSVNLHKEIRVYSWKKDKDGNVLDEPVKLLDHGMDAIRYCVYTHSKLAKSVSTVV